MLVVKIELWPFGDERAKREIGRSYIINRGDGDLTTGNYDAFVCRRGQTAKGAYMRTGEVVGFKRQSYNVWRLVLRALRSAFPEEK